MKNDLTLRRSAGRLLAAGALAVSLSPSLASAQTCGLANNAGFESGLAGWTNTAASVIVSDAHAGARAVRTGTGQGGINRTALIPVTAGQPVTFQVWAKVSGGPSWAGVGLDFLDASGGEISEISLQITSSSYALRQVMQTVPAGATAARLWTWKSGAVGNLFVDDFCLSGPAPSPSPTPPPASCGA